MSDLHYLCTDIVLFSVKTIVVMSKEELKSYRLNSAEEPTDEMLEAIMLEVQKTACQSTLKAKAELDKRFNAAKAEIAQRKAAYRVEL